VPEPSDPPTTSLQSVLDRLGALVLHHDADEAQLAATVTGVVIDDPDRAGPLAPGTAVLGVGIGAAARLAALVDRAVEAGASAVFVKQRSDGQPSAIAHGGVPVVEVAPDLGWEQLHVFVRTALLHVGDARPGGPQTLFDVANAIAVLVDGAIVIEDEHLRVLAYSNLDHPLDDARRATILGRQIPDAYVREIRAAGITAHLEGSDEPVRFDLEGPAFLPRLVVALRSGGRTIGLLWAIIDDEKEANARRVLADVAPDVAVELLQHLTADASRFTDRLAAAGQLLAGRPVTNLASLLGAEPTGGFVVLALQAVGGGADPDAAGRTAQFATVYVDAFRIPALVAGVTDGRVELVVGLTEVTPAARARELLDELHARAQATFGVELLGAVGAVAADVRGVPSSRFDAVAVLEHLADAGGTTAAYDEVQVDIALRELADAVRGAEHLGRGPLPRLLASTARSDVALVETVRTYLDAGGDVGRTAAALDVHRNTVRYRVTRFEELTGLTLDDPGTRLVVQAQLLAHPG
jgi:hypothetical protein